jgi:hypothetical protein
MHFSADGYSHSNGSLYDRFKVHLRLRKFYSAVPLNTRNIVIPGGFRKFSPLRAQALLVNSIRQL